MAPDPSTVWMVHRDTGLGGVRGDLILQGDRLIFRPEVVGARLDVLGETVLPLGDVRKVARARGSPVLELRVTTPGVPEVVLFYFVKPPDMYSSGLPNPRSHVATYLASGNALYDDEVKLWVRSLKAARQASD